MDRRGVGPATRRIRIPGDGIPPGLRGLFVSVCLLVMAFAGYASRGFRGISPGGISVPLAADPSPNPGAVHRRVQREWALDDFGLEENDATVWRLPGRLDEISGLAMTRDGRLLAHDDERGVVFEFDYRDGSIVKRFQLADLWDPVAADFEGIATADDRVWLVTSTGRLYESREGAAGESVLFRVHATGVGRDCEIEGLAHDESRRELLLLCKDARSAAMEGRLAIYRWAVEHRRLRDDARTVIPVREFSRHLRGTGFHPSGIELHPRTGNLFLVAARQRAIAEVTPDGQVLAVRRFPASWHRQVEGITFASGGELIVADEGAGRRARLTVYPGPYRPR